MLKRPSKRFIYGMLSLSLYTGLSACGPAPNTQSNVTPSASPTAASTPTPTPSASPLSAGSLRFRLVADPSLARFKTTQVEDFTLCLAQIARVSTRFTYNGALSAAASAALTAAGAQVEANGDSHVISFSSAANLAQLLTGISLSLPDVPAGSIEGRTTFFDNAGIELGFVTWQATLAGGAQDVTVTLGEADGATNPVSNACPRLKAKVTGASLRGAGGQLSGETGTPSASPTPDSSSSSPTPSPAAPAEAPSLPTGLQVVEQGATYLSLQWEFPADARSFKLYRDGVEVAANHVTPNYYRFEGLRESTNYKLGVRSVSPGGESAIAELQGTTLAEGGRSASGNFSSGGNGNTRSHDVEEAESVQVSEITDAGSLLSEVAINDDGDYVVTWFEFESVSDVKIRGQVFDKDGDSISSQFYVPTFSSIFSFGSPAVAMDEEGGFAIAWSEVANGAPDIFVQRYDSDGEQIGSRFTVNQYTSGSQKWPDIAMNDEGEFVVTWLGNGASTSNSNVYARRFDKEGSALSGEIQVDPTSQLLNTFPAVAMDDAGNFAVTWKSPTDSLQKVCRFDEDDNPGSVFTISEGIPFNGFSHSSGIKTADIAMGNNGSLVVSWFETGAGELEVMARTLSDDDEASEIIDVASESTTDFGVSTAVGMDENGHFVVSWGGDPTRVQISENSFAVYSQTIKAQRYFASGRKRRDLIELVANQDFDLNLITAVAMNDDGEFVLSWSAAEELVSDNIDILDIFLKRFED